MPLAQGFWAIRPGVYAPLEKWGCRGTRPGKVPGFWDGSDADGIRVLGDSSRSPTTPSLRHFISHSGLYSWCHPERSSRCHPERSEGSNPSATPQDDTSGRDDSGAPLRRHFIDEPHHALQPPRRIERAEIDAFDDRGPGRGPERPGEAGAPVVRIDGRDPLHHEAREARLDGGQHGVEAGVVVARHQRIAIVHPRAPRAGDGGLAAGGIGLVPALEVGGDGGLHRGGRPFGSAQGRRRGRWGSAGGGSAIGHDFLLCE
jgi:hypothetical protein